MQNANMLFLREATLQSGAINLTSLLGERSPFPLAFSSKEICLERKTMFISLSEAPSMQTRTFLAGPKPAFIYYQSVPENRVTIRGARSDVRSIRAHKKNAAKAESRSTSLRRHANARATSYFRPRSSLFPHTHTEGSTLTGNTRSRGQRSAERRPLTAGEARRRHSERQKRPTPLAVCYCPAFRMVCAE